MKKKKSARPGAPVRRSNSKRRSRDAGAALSWWPAVLLAALVALIVARTLTPEDPGGQHGHGAPFVVLWIILAGAWLLGQLRRGSLTVHWSWPDVAMLALVVWNTISAIAAFYSGAPRPALNVLWDWVAMGLAYLLARQIVRSESAMRAAMVAMIGLACGLSAVAVHQSLVTLPEARATYESIKDSTEALYQQTGQWMPPGSNMRQQFETRLASSLATATFALSNSFAGFLVPWLVVLGGIVFALLGPSSDLSPKGRGISFSAGLLVMALFAWCIVLTGSRSAGIAALLGLVAVLLPFLWIAVWPRPGLRWSCMSFLVVATAAAAFVASTSPGRTALAAAWRSLKFRIEYWQATVAMIADHPWLGCGPGQFQDAYTAYKLPWAAEEVQDPHNWLLEIWATAGTPAAIAIVVMLGFVIARVLRSRGKLTGNGPPQVEATDGQTVRLAALVGGLAGIALGALLAWWSGFALLKSQLLLLAAGMTGVWWLLRGWNRDGPLPYRLPLAAAAAMLVNLLAAGGISFPSVADSLWLLVAMQLNLTELHDDHQAAVRLKVASPRTKFIGWAACLGLAGVLLAAMWTEYLPVMGCRWRLDLADAALAARQPDQYRAALDEAVVADPWSAPAAEFLAALRFADYQTLPTATQLDSFTEAIDRASSLVPQRSNSWAQSAECFATIYERTGNVEDFDESERRWQRAIELYPTHARLYGGLARLLASAGRADETQAAAAEALRLDDLKRDAGHDHKLLNPSLRNELESLTQ